MNIKSLLLGSAAALFAVSGARAADAVVIAEPEPMDYVRICDTYGAGYYYIPGTETCLSIRGLVRYQISFAEDDDGWRKNAKGVLDITAKSETELGTLTGFISIVGTTEGLEYSGSAPVASMYMEYITITLGGLSMGLSDSVYDVDVGAEWDKGGGRRAHYISYTFAGGNGFSATVALEEEDTNSDYIPNVIGRVGFTQGWGGVDFWVAYDDEDDRDDEPGFGAFGNTDDEFYGKVIGTFNFNDTVKLAVMGIYETGPGFYSVAHTYSVAAHLEAAISDRLSVGFGGQYFGDAHDDGDDGYSIGGEIAYKIVENFSTKLQVQYDDEVSTWNNSSQTYGEEDGFSGWVRFERSF